MKWVKVAIGVVIAIAIIPLLVISIKNIEPSLLVEKIEEEKIIITFEVNFNYTDTGYFHHYNVTDIPMSDIWDYINNDYNITNLSISFDTNVVDITIIDYYTEPDPNPEAVVTIDNNSMEFIFSIYDLSITDTYDTIYSINAENLSSINIIFSKDIIVKKPGIITTLLSFIPIIFIGGVLLYFYKPFKKED